MIGPGAVVASSFLARCAELGVRPPPELRLLAWDDPDGEAEPLAVPADLGRLHERLVSGAERTRRGAWYTPPWLAEDLVGRAVRRPGVVSDPSCGGGVFLLAAAERLRALGAPPDEIVRSLLWGADVDALAVAVSEAALWWWSTGEGASTVAGARLVLGDPLTDVEIPRSVAVVGNPPFLGQLKASTAIEDRRRRALKDRWGAVVQPYTDAAWLFLLAAVDALDADGTVALVQPQSVLAARDATTIRAAVDRRAQLTDCWVGDDRTFTASVEVCAPVLRATAQPSVNDWGAARSTVLGIPDVALDGSRTVGDIATLLSGFRDEYYGLVDAVAEQTLDRERGAGLSRPLVTVGAIDPLCLRPAAIRFARRRWEHPVVDVARTGGRARRWVDGQHRPKLLVATQTRVVEAVVDERGDLVGSVPVIAVCPNDPADLWHIAAALHAPAVSAWMLRRSGGTALSADAAKPTKALLGALPLPDDLAAWDAAAAAARDLAAGAGDWERFGAIADAAYGRADRQTLDWWHARLPVR